MSKVRRTRAESDSVIWHDVECGSYAADLPLWDELAERVRGPILELGAGTGRVSLHLARRGHQVTAVESEPELADALEWRAREDALAVHVGVADARALTLGRSFALVLAPMQLLQILGGPPDWQRCLVAIRAHLGRRGLAALALVAEVPEAAPFPAPVPDVREHDGWVYSSLPLGVERHGSAATVRRLRQRVSPTGELVDAEAEVRLELIDFGEVERAAAERGLRLLERRAIPPTDAHVGSTALILEAV